MTKETSDTVALYGFSRASRNKDERRAVTFDSLRSDRSCLFVIKTTKKSNIRMCNFN